MTFTALAAGCLLCSLASYAQDSAADVPAPASQAALAAANPFLGSWKEAKGQPGTTRVRIYEDKGDGLMLHTILTISPQDTGFTFAAVRYDGQEYPVFVPKTLGAFINGDVKPPRTAAYFKRDDHTLEWTERVEGKIARTAVFKVSPDGKTLTENVKEFDPAGKQTGTSVIAYEKQ